MRLVLLLAVLVPAVAAQPCDGPARLADDAPELARLAGGDAAALASLHAYVCAFARADAATLDHVVSLRDSVILHLGRRVEAAAYDEGDPPPLRAGRSLYDDAADLGLRLVSVEGFDVGLAPAPLPQRLRSQASAALGLYLDALAAIGDTQGGEYPYLDLGAELDVIRLGEALRERFPASPYVAATQGAFGQAVLDLAGLHPVRGGDGQWLAGPVSNSFWPFAGDRAALAWFVRDARGSRYYAPLAAILADPPESTTDGAVDLLVVARRPTWDGARAHALELLDAGIDVVGPVSLGERDVAVLYRYFPAGDARLDAAEARAVAHGLDVERVRVDVADLWGF